MKAKSAKVWLKTTTNTYTWHVVSNKDANSLLRKIRTEQIRTQGTRLDWRLYVDGQMIERLSKASPNFVSVFVVSTLPSVKNKNK